MVIYPSTSGQIIEYISIQSLHMFMCQSYHGGGAY